MTSNLERSCSQCNMLKPVLEFSRRTDRGNSLKSECKTCAQARTAKWKQDNKSKVKEQSRRYSAKNAQKIAEKNKRRYQQNKESILESRRQARVGKTNCIKAMFSSAKSRAKKNNLDFNLDLEYLTSIAVDFCPVDGLPFDWDRQLIQDKTLPLSVPSLDRVDSSQGYIKGNVQIIGWKWNSKKSNMNLEDLLLLVEYVRNATKAKNSDHF